MKRLILLSLCVSFYLGVHAQVTQTVATTAGQLATDASAYLATVTNLTITGTIDACDFKTMRDGMPLLAMLDISTVTIAAYSGTEGTETGDVIYPVNEIPISALAYKASLTSVVMPSSITSIGNDAFNNCTELSGTLVIPSSVITIGDFAFNSCSKLTGILTIPSSVTSIGTYAFGGCSGFTGQLTIPSSITSIKRRTFRECEGLTGPLTIPSSVTNIGEEAFQNCFGLSGQLSFSSSDITIEESAFIYCSKIESIKFADDLSSSSKTIIGRSAFALCSGLTGSLIISGSDIYIGRNAFEDCNGLKSVIV